MATCICWLLVTFFTIWHTNHQTNIYVHTHQHTHTHMYVYVYFFSHINMHTYIYIQVYHICIYTYIYIIYVYTYPLERAQVKSFQATLPGELLYPLWDIILKTRQGFSILISIKWRLSCGGNNLKKIKLLQNYKWQPKNYLGLNATHLIIFISKNAEKIPLKSQLISCCFHCLKKNLKKSPCHLH